MFLKWSIPWGTPEHPTSEAPSIIAIFIKMALSPGQWDPVLIYYGLKLTFYYRALVNLCTVMKKVNIKLSSNITS